MAASDKTPWVDIVALIVAFVLGGGSLIASVFSYGTAKEANSIAKQAKSIAAEQTLGAARTEITGYASEIVRLDREADIRNSVEIAVLVDQSYGVIQEYSQGQLQLSASTWQVLAEYSAFDTYNYRLSFELARQAVSVSANSKPFADPDEEVESEQAWATAAAQSGQVGLMQAHLLNALAISKMSPQDRTLQVQATYTQAFAVFLAIRASDTSSGDANRQACSLAIRYFNDGGAESIKREIQSASLETSRRAFLISNHRKDAKICGKSSGLSATSLHLVSFDNLWFCNPQRPGRDARGCRS